MGVDFPSNPDTLNPPPNDALRVEGRNRARGSRRKFRIWVEIVMTKSLLGKRDRSKKGKDNIILVLI